jgi:ABC-type polysaccharide/polyol phosphate export permease
MKPDDRTDGRHLTRWDAFRTLCLSRFRLFYRESEVIFWSFVFPIVLSVALGAAFRNRPVDVFPVAVASDAPPSALASLRAASGVRVSVLADEEAARQLRLGRVMVVVKGDGAGGVTYRYDDTRPDATVARLRVDEALQRGAGRVDPLAAKDQPIREAGSRYIDFLIPGILGMNLMSGGLWGMGFHLVDLRIKKLLKRLIATPMHRGDFMLAQMTIRVVFMFVEVMFLLLFGWLAFGVPVRGSIFAVLTVGLVGALTFGGIGLLVASRAATIEKVSGLMNVVMMPMFICSGTFFSADRFPAAMQPFIQALPLTALNDAFRAVILEGATLGSQAGELGILAAWGFVSFVVGLKLFRWN